MKSDLKIINDFTDLTVWQLAHQLKIEVYSFTELLPDSEKYNRVIQLKKAVSSISANIAEGFGRYHFQENIQFCRQARGSLDETKDHLITSRDLHEAPIERCNGLVEKCNLVVFKGTFFFPNGEFEIINSCKLYMDRALTMVDDNFAKKIETDALTKAISKLGFIVFKLIN